MESELPCRKNKSNSWPLPISARSMPVEQHGAPSRYFTLSRPTQRTVQPLSSNSTRRTSRSRSARSAKKPYPQLIQFSRRNVLECRLGWTSTRCVGIFIDTCVRSPRTLMSTPLWMQIEETTEGMRSCLSEGHR